LRRSAATASLTADVQLGGERRDPAPLAGLGADAQEQLQLDRGQTVPLGLVPLQDSLSLAHTLEGGEELAVELAAGGLLARRGRCHATMVRISVRRGGHQRSGAYG
jgi:hypothetical protein